MKIFAQLLLWSSLGIGAVSAATAYLVSLNTSDDQLIGLTLAAPTGRIEQPDGTTEPIATKDDQLTAELLTELRAAGVQTLRIKQFSFTRWQGKWFFLLSLVGLTAGGLLSRTRPQDTATESGEPTKTPEQTLHALHQQLQQLQTDLSKQPDDTQRLDLIVQRIGQFQRTDIPAFVDARETLIASHGLSGYAALMDTFAAAERQLNRAWSAAVDQHLDESTTCLEQANALLEETQARL
jgi:hypothetical protein